ncbi:DNA polymerase III subunit gamma/tau [Shewanella algae]|uniref:DNA polymerase III subunit gamma/tau n=1 Tax=Shewanella algae TaxID=38313 RepID=UPI001BEF44A5|nr:DNA polymerase III subunit gamma/tau [Shewanella algae]BCV33130.1 DNA polymerase III subunit gamma/tau [Shewanella algae]
MSYQVLARKWRPASFDQVVGQSHVLHALTNALSQQRLHHAYLFTGTRGVGKTSLARLFAKGLNCETGITAKPCGQCSACQEIAQGRFVDLIEVDAASRTKVDDTRELLDNVQYRPTRGRFKVYLIDEVHMLSRSSFNALLKTLEEPPEHVKFLLATTDPQKLPVTVLSRCLQFNLKSLDQTEMAGQLQHILQSEGLKFETSALTLLARAANGSMRDALSLTDQAIAFGAGQVMLEQVQTMLGAIDERQVLALFDALLTGDIAKMMQEVAKVLAFGADAAEVLRSLLELLHQITLSQFAPAAANLSLFGPRINHYGENLTPEQVQLYYQLLLSGRKELPYAPDPKSGLEMALLRAVAFVPETPPKRWQRGEVADLSALDNSNSAAAPAAVGAPNQHLASNNVDEIKPQAASAQSVTSQAVEAQAEKTQAAKMPTQVSPAAETQASSGGAQMAAGEGEDADEQALLAEQALLLSQASSMGFRNKASVPLQASPSQMNASKTSVAEANAAIESVKVTESLPVEQTAAAQPHKPVSQAETSTIGDEQQSQDDFYAAMGYSQQGEGLDSSLDFYQQQMSMNGQMPSAADKSISEASLSNKPSSEPVPADANIDSGSDDILGDDLLDQVLATRDLLLSDIEAASPKDGEEKKPLLERRSAAAAPESDAVAATQSEAAAEPGNSPELSKSPERVDSLEPSNNPEPSQAETQTPVAGEVPSESGPSHVAALKEDRPPWEDAPEGAVEAGREAMQDSETVQNVAFPQAEPESVPEFLPEPEPEPQHTAQQTAQEAAPQAVDEPGHELKNELELGSGQSTRVNTVNTGARPASEPGQAPGPESAEAFAHAPPCGHPQDLYWYKLMSSLEIGGRVRQLAVNSVCERIAEPLPLLLKPDQKHLAADSAIKQLEEALSKLFGKPCRTEIVVGVDDQRETPLEIRHRFHQELLSGAHASLMNDENIQWLVSHMGAELDQDTLGYPPELLSQRANLIADKAP